MAKLIVPHNLHAFAAKNGWMSSKRLEEWIHKVLERNEDDVLLVLILDRAPIHVTKEVASLLSDLDAI